MPKIIDKSDEQKDAEADVESFHDDLGPFVVAAETTRMAMVFSDACDPDNPIIFANDSFLELTGYSREDHGVQISDGRPLVAIAKAAQPEGRRYVGTDRAVSQRLPSQASHPSSMAECTLRRQSPEVRATCGKPARVDLCGGRSVMGVPTAIDARQSG